MKIKKHSLVIALFFILTVNSTAQDRGPILTNEQVVIKAVREGAAAAGIFDRLTDVRFDPVETGPGRAIYGGLAEALTARGISIHSENEAASMTTGFDILGFDFRYKKGKSRGFLRKPMINRSFNARIRVTVTGLATGKVLGMEDISATYTDELDPDAENLIKSRDIPELAPAAPVSGWTKIVEPVVVTTAVGGLVYLFFANR